MTHGTRRFFTRPLISISALALLLSGCGGASAPGSPPGNLTPSAAASPVKFVIVVPKATTPSAHPKYVSPATQSMTVSILQGATSVLNQTVGLTTSSAGCASSLASTTCTLQVTLAAGSYTASITTYDGLNGAGTALSVAQNLAFTVVANQSNTVPLGLNGIPAKILVANAGATSVYVETQDADGNFIIGPGSPTFTAAKTAGSALVTITQPTASAPNTVALALAAPAPSLGTETIGITASYPSGTNACTQVGAVCTVPAAISVSYTSTAFVANNTAGNILGFSVPLSSSTQSPTYSLSASFPYVIALDSAGNVFSASSASPASLIEASAPYTSVALTNALGGNSPLGMAISAAGNVFLANTGGGVSMYASPYTAAPTLISTGLTTPYAAAIDASNNLYVADHGSSKIAVFASPYGGAPTTVSTTSAPISLAISGTNLFVGEGTAIDVFSLPLTGASTPAATLTTGISSVFGITADPNGNLWATNLNGGSGSQGSVVEFTAPFISAAAPAVTISLPVAGFTSNAPQGLAFDATGNLYVVNGSGGALSGGLLEFASPISSASTPAFGVETSQLNQPANLAISKPTLTVTP